MQQCISFSFGEDQMKQTTAVKAPLDTRLIYDWALNSPVLEALIKRESYHSALIKE